MIDDQELCALFKAESEEHLQSLDEGLLRLESDPTDGATLEAVFRAAHSLKGAARMLDVSGVERLAHQLEDGLGAARRGRAVLTGEVVDRFYRALDAIRQLVREAVTGEPAEIDLESALAQVRGETTPEPRADPARTGTESVPSPRPAPVSETDGAAPPPAAVPPSVKIPPPHVPDDGAAARPAHAPPPAEPRQGGDRRPPSTDFRIETIRVEPQKLDGVMTLAGELTVMATRVVRSLAEFQAMDALQTACADADRLVRVADELEEAVRTLRLLPLSTLFGLFPRLVRDLARSQAKEIELVIEGGETSADKRLLEELKDPLTHLLRNAIDHGIELPEERERSGKPCRATLLLRAYQTAANVVVELADDGRGLDLEAIRRTAVTRGVCRREELEAMSSEQIEQLIFAPGFSTRAEVSELSGRGVGLDVVRTNVAGLKGAIHVESSPGRGCLFRLEMPITLATTHVLLVQAAGRPYAIPVEAVQSTLLLPEDAIFPLEGRDAFRYEGQPIPVARLADLLELPSVAAGQARGPAPTVAGRTREPAPTVGAGPRARPGPSSAESPEPRVTLPCILLSVHGRRVALLADALLDEQEVILKPLGPLLRRVRNVAGATILGTGEVCMVLNPDDLVTSLQEPRLSVRTGVGQAQGPAPTVGAGPRACPASPKALLLAEDSITTRTQMRRILEGAGYEVVTAVDGADALGKLATQAFDGLISDIEMPKMDGLQLTARVRQDPRHKELPIILVTSLASEEDRRRGIEVGANAYITKGTFDQNALLETLRRLV